MDTSLVPSFVKRYELWLAVHSFLFYQDQQALRLVTETTRGRLEEEDEELAETREYGERCRMATLAAIFASREVRSGLSLMDPE